MSTSLIKKVSELHDHLAKAVAARQGEELTQAEVQSAYRKAFPQRTNDLQWIQASDHSLNHTNRAPCKCSGTESALFERISHGKYRVR